MVEDFFKYRYGWEKFHAAVHSLSGEGTIQERLENAYIFNIIHLRCDNDIPEELHREFNELVTMMTSVVDPNGSVHATVYAMNDLERSIAVEKIIGIYDSICRYMPRN